MKIYLSGVIMMAVVLSFCSSCQKEVEGTLPVNETLDSIYLSKYAVLDTTLPAGQDTTFIVNFFYNSNKRIKKYTYSYPDPIVTDGGEVEYSYNGSDTLPYMMIEKSITNGVAYYLDTVRYSYANGLVIKDSTVSRRIANNEILFKSGTSYTVSGSNVLVQWNSWLSPGIINANAGTVSVSLSGNNIVSQTADPDITEYEYCQVAYDNKINPFYRIDFPYPVYRNINNDIFGRHQRNNILSENLGDDPGSIFNQFRTTYTYRNDGYPLVSRTIDLMNAAYHEKGLFFYTHL